MKRNPAQGFTLIELMVVVAIVAIIAVLAIPNFIDWMQNTKTRTTADSIQNGLRFAQSEAIRMSRQTTFAPTSTSWTVDYIANSIASSMDKTPHPLQVSPVGGLENTVISLGTGTPTVLLFNSLGRVFDGSGATPVALAKDVAINVKNPKGSRKLRIIVSPSGKVRMCDPDKTFDATTTPDGCPAQPT